MSGNTNTGTYQNANPLLYTFRDYHTGIQPYFVIVTQFFIFDISLRCWDRAVYGTWLTPSDFIVIERDAVGYGGNIPAVRRTQETYPSFMVSTVLILQGYKKKFSLKIANQKKKPKFDLFDILFSVLPLLAHSIWYCYIQSSCMSGANANTWNCYQLFGYRLYNCVFSSFSGFAGNFIGKLILTFKQNEFEKVDLAEQKPESTLSRVIHYTALWSSVITFVFVGAMVLPYIVTNAIPMMIIFSSIVVLYLYVCAVVIFALHCFTNAKRMRKANRKLIAADPHDGKFHFNQHLAIQFAIKIFPYLMTILFNLSQYFYYGSDYLQALTKEADSRDPAPYFIRVGYSPDQIIHTILTTL